MSWTISSPVISSLKLRVARPEPKRTRRLSPHELGLAPSLLKKESQERELLRTRTRLPQQIKLSQKMIVLRCDSCKMYQVHINKNLSKWTCQVCHVKSSVKQICFQGPRSNCRYLIQKLNKGADHTVSIPSRRDAIGATYNPFVNYYKESGNNSGAKSKYLWEFLTLPKIEDLKDVENLMSNNEANNTTSTDTSSENEDDGDTSSEGEDVSDTSSESEDDGDTSCESKNGGYETEGLRTTSFNRNSNIDDECNMLNNTKPYKFNNTIAYLTSIRIEDLLYRQELRTSTDTNSESEDVNDTSCESKDVGNETEGLRTTSCNHNFNIDDGRNMLVNIDPLELHHNLICFTDTLKELSDTNSESEDDGDTSCESKDVGNETEGLRTTSCNHNFNIDDGRNMLDNIDPFELDHSPISLPDTLKELSDTNSESEDDGDTSCESKDVGNETEGLRTTSCNHNFNIDDGRNMLDNIDSFTLHYIPISLSDTLKELFDTSFESEDDGDTSCESKDVGNETEGLCTTSFNRNSNIDDGRNMLDNIDPFEFDSFICFTDTMKKLGDTSSDDTRFL
ncbi:dentin sialophosphoprotein-like isoform X2 [Nylanderia fulva]|uniref:dentin sialophosphoprotein-like isoform X2 n=1 Tax=Nylanderia fulva TaxID=613905 RepID=UPI0010FB6431|nr:dentin sialophosphoprotein-like isoform X2 [Nylanderia fulva]